MEAIQIFNLLNLYIYRISVLHSCYCLLFLLLFCCGDSNVMQ